MKMAPVTPAMLPVPTVPASAVLTAWKGDRFSPWSAPEGRNRVPTVLRRICPNRRTWMHRVRTVSQAPVPTRSSSITGPQAKSFSTPLTAWMPCSNFSIPFSSLSPFRRCFLRRVSFMIPHFLSLLQTQMYSYGKFISFPQRRREGFRRVYAKNHLFFTPPGPGQKSCFSPADRGLLRLAPAAAKGIIDSDRRLRIFRAASSAGYLAVSGEKEN